MKHIMRAPLILLLAVHFIFAHNWENNPSDYELQMTMTGVILINNENSLSDDYFIGAFVGDECRGFASSINVFDDQMFFLTLYSNQPDESISFRVFTDYEYAIIESEQFIPFGSLGTPNNPNGSQPPPRSTVNKVSVCNTTYGVQPNTGNNVHISKVYGIAPPPIVIFA